MFDHLQIQEAHRIMAGQNHQRTTPYNIMILSCHDSVRLGCALPRNRLIPSAFSLIELLVAVGLMSLIVLGLLVMFQQTQRAFTGSMTQVDMLEGARATTDLIERELEQMTPSHTPYAANFVSELAPAEQNFTPAFSYQDLPGTGSPPLRRLNVLHHFFFLTRENQTWRGIGYLVGTPAFGVGTLYRFWQETNSSVGSLRTNFDTAASQLYHNRFPTNLLTRMVDGVVHLRVRAYNTNGFLIVSNVLSEPFVQVKWDPRTPISGTEVDYYFWSNAVPAYVELEIGFLEDRAVGRFKSLGSPTATSANAVQQQYLQNHVGQVHLFRRRVAIRDVDTLAYK